MVKQTAYHPGFEDWLFHLVLPLAAYALLVAASFEADAHIFAALFLVAGSALLLLFVGIHNAWDAVAITCFSTSTAHRMSVTRKTPERRRNDRKHRETRRWLPRKPVADLDLW
jgi:hypothetical protein